MPEFTRDEHDDMVFPEHYGNTPGRPMHTPDVGPIPKVEEAPPPGMEDLRKLCAAMKAKQEEKVALEEALAKVNIDFDRMRLNEIPQLMESLGVKNATFAGLGRVQTATDLYASTREGKKAAAMQWLRDCGYADLITETYNASSLKAVFRGLIKEGTMPPDDIFSVTPFVRASIVKG